MISLTKTAQNQNLDSLYNLVHPSHQTRLFCVYFCVISGPEYKHKIIADRIVLLVFCEEKKQRNSNYV